MSCYVNTLTYNCSNVHRIPTSLVSSSWILFLPKLKWGHTCIHSVNWSSTSIINHLLHSSLALPLSRLLVSIPPVYTGTLQPSNIQSYTENKGRALVALAKMLGIIWKWSGERTQFIVNFRSKLHYSMWLKEPYQRGNALWSSLCSSQSIFYSRRCGRHIFKLRHECTNKQTTSPWCHCFSTRTVRVPS